MRKRKLYQVLQQVVEKSPWANFLVNSQCELAGEDLEILETCFSHLPLNSQSEVCQIIRKDHSARIEATLYELIAHELLWRLGYSPVFQPKLTINGRTQTPDISVVFEDQPFLIDVYAMHNPLVTITFNEEGSTGGFDSGNRSRKIMDVFGEKVGRYKDLNKPIVLIIFLADKFMLTQQYVEEALFGCWLEEIGEDDHFPADFMGRTRPSGLLLPDLDDKSFSPSYQELSATIVCNWFWMGGKGRRLSCTVLHHWNPHVYLPIETFSQCLQINWIPQDGKWVPRYTKETFTAAEFIGDDHIHFHSVECPW